MTQQALVECRRFWLRLRLFRAAGTVLIDYRIMKNHVRVLLAAGEFGL
jgi:hypothetical protein